MAKKGSFRLTPPGAIVLDESTEQQNLIRWANLSIGKYPQLRWLHAIPNGGPRHVVAAQRLKAEGVKKGVPDLFLPVARGRWHGMYIEMKRTKGGTISPEQKEFIEFATQQGYRAVICKGFEAARCELINYLETT